MSILKSKSTRHYYRRGYARPVGVRALFPLSPPWKPPTSS